MARSTLLPARVRGAALMPAAVLTVHQLRYLLAFGGGTEASWRRGARVPRRPGGPIAMSVAIGAGVFLAGLARARREGERGEAGPAPRPLPPASGSLVGAALLGLYSCQELLEGMLSHRPPRRPRRRLRRRRVWAVPLSLASAPSSPRPARGAAAIRWAAALVPRAATAPAARARALPRLSLPRPRRWRAPQPAARRRRARTLWPNA